MLGMKDVSRDQPPWDERDSASKKRVSFAEAAQRLAASVNAASNFVEGM